MDNTTRSGTKRKDERETWSEWAAALRREFEKDADENHELGLDNELLAELEAAATEIDRVIETYIDEEFLIKLYDLKGGKLHAHSIAILTPHRVLTLVSSHLYPHASSPPLPLPPPRTSRRSTQRDRLSLRRRAAGDRLEERRRCGQEGGEEGSSGCGCGEVGGGDGARCCRLAAQLTVLGLNPHHPPAAPQQEGEPNDTAIGVCPFS